MASAAVHLWIREEVKPFEHRVALDPAACAELMASGFKITVERMSERCVPDADYEAAGCTLVPGGTWVNAPNEAIIVGLKELPDGDSPLTHRHLYFGHAYKNQAGWKELLQRFKSGGGELLDLEYITNDKGQRVAAFGFMAGFAGAAVGLLQWCHSKTNPGETLPPLLPYENEGAMISAIKEKLAAAMSLNEGVYPTTLIMGALGRCGRGAQSLLRKADVPDESIVCWDMEETKDGGPFPALLKHDIFVNSIYLSKKIPPFLTAEMLNTADRKLTVVVDVSCDTTNPHNPLPFCDKSTTFDVPTFFVTPTAGPPVGCITIDHLPTLLPLESSQHFARDLLPSIVLLKTAIDAPVWGRVRKLFEEKSAEATQAV